MNQVTSASLRYPLSVFNKNSTLKIVWSTCWPIYTYTHVYILTHTHPCIHTFVCGNIHTNSCMYIWNIYVYIYIIHDIHNTYICTYIYIIYTFLHTYHTYTIVRCGRVLPVMVHYVLQYVLAGFEFDWEPPGEGSGFEFHL